MLMMGGSMRNTGAGSVPPPAADCVTVNGKPAIAIVPVRELTPAFAPTKYLTVPFPVPAAPEVMVSQDAPLDAVHAVVCTVAVTCVEPVPPLAPMLADEAESVNVFGVTLPPLLAACVTVNVKPAMVNVPVRALSPVFAATEYPTAPFPVPVKPNVIMIHDALLDEVNAEVAGFAVTFTVPPPPLAETFVVVFDKVNTALSKEPPLGGPNRKIRSVCVISSDPFGSEVISAPRDPPVASTVCAVLPRFNCTTRPSVVTMNR